MIGQFELMPKEEEGIPTDRCKRKPAGREKDAPAVSPHQVQLQNSKNLITVGWQPRHGLSTGYCISSHSTIRIHARMVNSLFPPIWL